jgi:hypothetical protein
MDRLPCIMSAVAVAAALASGCGDEALAPSGDGLIPLPATSQQRQQMQSELAFVSQQSARAITPSVAALIRGIEHNDLRMVEQGLAGARAAVDRYRNTRGAQGAADPDLEALTLTLDRVAALATPAQDAQQ